MQLLLVNATFFYVYHFVRWSETQQRRVEIADIFRTYQQRQKQLLKL